MYTVDHTFGYHSQKFIHAYAKLSVYDHGTEIRGENFGNILGTRKVMDGLPLTRKVTYRYQTAIQGQGRFTKCGLPQAIQRVM